MPYFKPISVFMLTVAFLSISLLLNTQIESSVYYNWKQLYGVKYDTAVEDHYRSMVFMNNVKKIKAHNADLSQTFTMGVNQFTALTQLQFENIYMSNLILPPHKTQIKTSQQIYVAEDIDWVALGAVTAVKAQGQCGASWAFSGTGSLQGLHQIMTGNLKTFSDQQLLDCSGDFCSCVGGFVDMAFRYVQSHGICEESQYPYVQVKQACKNMACGFKIKDYDMADNCADLAKSLSKQPVSVAVEASNWVFYNSGVFSNCGTKINYMALLVGIVDGNWKVKNSLGASWGEKGYIRLAPGNTCGICSIGLFPTK